MNMERQLQLNRMEFFDKVLGCYLGKNIGGTLGAPYEGKKYVLDLDFYTPVPSEPLPNDDLDLQLVWLAMLEEKGPAFTLNDLAEFWMRHCPAYPWNEYGFFVRNHDRGLRPPVSGWFENYYVDEMGSPIRSEIWACMAPGDPARAAELAWRDSCVDHAGGEGMWGELFWAAVQSAAFFESDRDTLIRLGLRAIPPASGISRVIREACCCYGRRLPWAEARDRIWRIFYNDQPCNAIVNTGFTLLGWLYGNDFGDKLCKAVNCGYDTDCTGATLGATLGIIAGAKGLPERWLKPVGTGIVLHKFTTGFAALAPADVTELAVRIVRQAERFVAEGVCRVPFTDGAGSGSECPELDAAAVEALWRRDVRCAEADAGEYVLRMHYHGDPVLAEGETREFSFSMTRHGKPVTPERATLTPPPGWRADGWRVTAGKSCGTAYLNVEVELDRRTLQGTFAILSPETASGYPAGTMIERCPVCTGTPGHCLCQL